MSNQRHIGHLPLKFTEDVGRIADAVEKIAEHHEQCIEAAQQGTDAPDPLAEKLADASEMVIGILTDGNGNTHRFWTAKDSLAAALQAYRESQS